MPFSGEPDYWGLSHTVAVVNGQFHTVLPTTFLYDTLGDFYPYKSKQA